MVSDDEPQYSAVSLILCVLLDRCLDSAICLMLSCRGDLLQLWRAINHLNLICLFICLPVLLDLLILAITFNMPFLSTTFADLVPVLSPPDFQSESSTLFAFLLAFLVETYNRFRQRWDRENPVCFLFAVLRNSSLPLEKLFSRSSTMPW